MATNWGDTGIHTSARERARAHTHTHSCWGVEGVLIKRSVERKRQKGRRRREAWVRGNQITREVM